VGLAQNTPGPNSAPNPYRVDEGWAKLETGRKWGAAVGVDIDRDGKSIWVFDRCATADDCSTSNLNPIQKFDASGKLVTSFGAGMINYPHALYVDRDDNIWVSDGRAKNNGKGHTVMKFSPQGKLLMTLGKAGGAAEPDYFYQPNDVLVAPNGDIFVSEGHGGANARVLKFTKDGKFIKSFGKKGSGPGEMEQPHALAMDSRGRLFVGDRSNNRILIYDQDGKLLDTWPQFSRPSGIYIDANDVIYVADSESESVARNHDGWKRGIRIGSAKDGKVTAFIPDPVEKATGTSAAEGVAVDRQGNIWGAEVGPRGVKKYVKN